MTKKDIEKDGSSTRNIYKKGVLSDTNVKGVFGCTKREVEPYDIYEEFGGVGK